MCSLRATLRSVTLSNRLFVVIIILKAYANTVLEKQIIK